MKGGIDWQEKKKKSLKYQKKKNQPKPEMVTNM